MVIAGRPNYVPLKSGSVFKRTPEMAITHAYACQGISFQVLRQR